MSKKNLVVQTKDLIEAHYKQTFSTQELKTVLLMISEIHKEDFFKLQKYEHKEIEIPVKKYAEMMGINLKHVSRDAEKIADTLGSKRFTMKTLNGWINLGWISSMEYKHSEGIIRILVSPDLIPYITQLKPYTYFDLENVLSLGSSYAIKIYQLLVQYRVKGERTDTLDNLRSMLGIENSKGYLAYKNFKKRILEISKREINKHTDLNMSYSEIKKGRKVDSIKFKITSKNSEEENKKQSVLFQNTLPKELQTKISIVVIEKSNRIALAAKTGWDIYAIEQQFYEYIKKVGPPKNLDAAFLGFVKKKVAKKPC